MNPAESSVHVQQPGDAAVAARLKEIKIFDKQWEALKEVLEPLFKKETIAMIASQMERRFHFRAKFVIRLLRILADVELTLC